MQAQKPDDRGRSLVSIMLELGLGLRQAGGGEGGIRTHGTLPGTPHFECGTFDHSATSPRCRSRLVERGASLMAQRPGCKREKPSALRRKRKAKSIAAGQVAVDDAEQFCGSAARGRGYDAGGLDEAGAFDAAAKVLLV